MQKLDAESVFGFSSKLKETKLIDDFVLWLEQRPNECGRTTLLIRRLEEPDSCPFELTPAPFNLRTRIHGYGGAPYAVECYLDQLILVWIDDSNGCLWKQSWSLSNKKLFEQNILNLKPSSKPICLSKEDNSYLGDGLIDLKRMQWIGLMEKDDKDYIVTFSLLDELEEPYILYRASGFLGYFKLNPNGDRLAWIEWQNKDMPWERSQLWKGDLGDNGELTSLIFVAGSKSNDNISVFQPIWFNNFKLIFTEDYTGWWNLKSVDFDINNKIIAHDQICNIEADLGLPQWVAGMSTIAISNDQIVALSCSKSIWSLILISLTGLIKKIDIPYDDMSYLDAKNGKAILIASNSMKEPILIEVDLILSDYNEQKNHNKLPLKSEEISVGESIWYSGFNKLLTQAWYYPPCIYRFKKTPLLVKIHSGPTSMTSRSLDLTIQYWTSRGWAVLDVNYGGSTGFGKKYRDRLKGGWGEVDSFDCISAASELVRLGKVDNELIVVEGSSAGGFTALSSIFRSDIFKAAACKYPVTDLIDMHKNTHRFESGYLNFLLGTFEDNQDRYFARSPINNIDKINTPIILFHGLKDNVVNIEQSKQIFHALKNRKVPVEFHKIPNEGHGFKDKSVNVDVLHLTEYFFTKHLGIAF